MRFVLVIVALFFPACAFASQEDSGILYGPQNAFVVTAPKGWVLDNQNAVSQGVHMAFYPVGGSWENSAVIMYANGVAKTDDGKTLADFVAEDAENFKNRPNLQVKDYPDIALENKKTIAKYYSYAHTEELVLYIEEPKSISMLILTANLEKPSAHEQFMQIKHTAFEELVHSYSFLTNDVRVEKK